MSDKIFELGICMAGSVSAGAYSAGVIDYLLEALEHWESKRGEAGVPDHRVVIKVIGGASGGGITSILTAANSRFEHYPVRTLAQRNIMATFEDNKFYHTWVDMLQDDMLTLLLDCEDLRDNKLESLLNSNFIDLLAKRALNMDLLNLRHKSYFDKGLKFFTTLSNLGGLPYAVEFKGGAQLNQHQLTRHRDYATFTLDPLEEVSENGWIPVDFDSGKNVDYAAHAAMATSAFPVGLKARKFTRPSNWVNAMQWHKDISSVQPIRTPLYTSMNVDGGMINNEPFERVEEVLTMQKEHCKDMEQANYALLLIDPLPSELEQTDPKLSSEALEDILVNTLGAMLGQLRTKPETLKECYREGSNRFVISPVRHTESHERIEGSKALAGGFLGAFGGFVHKEFRIHDFFLGRANCERMLREHFVTDSGHDNAVTRGYSCTRQEGETLAERLQIIPLFEKEHEVPYMPTFSSGKKWPIQSSELLNQHDDVMVKRIKKLLFQQLGVSSYSWVEQVAVKGLFRMKRGSIKKRVKKVILNSMDKHKLLK